MGEDCPNEASSADPDGDCGDKPKSPITAAALLVCILTPSPFGHSPYIPL